MILGLMGMPKGAYVVAHVRNGGGFVKSERDKRCEKRLHSGCILKTGLLGLLTTCSKI